MHNRNRLTSSARMSHYADSSYGGKRHAAKNEAAKAFADVPAEQVKKGQLLLWHDKKIEELIDLLSLFGEDDKKTAKENSAARKQFCIVMGHPEPIKVEGESKIRIPLIHGTKSISSRFRNQIYRPLPHSSKFYKEYTKKEPLKVKDGSPESEHQTYMIPYEIFYAVTDPQDTHVV